LEIGCKDWHLRCKIFAEDRHKGANTGRFCYGIHTDYGTKRLKRNKVPRKFARRLGLVENIRGLGFQCQGVRNRVVIITPDETVIEQSIRLDFKTSNNEAEYEVVLARLNLAKTLGAKQLIVHCDSLLVTSQINGVYMARDERMAAYLLKIQQTMTSFQTVRVEQIGQNLNSHADALATLASVVNADFKRFIPIETLAIPSIAMPACHIHTIMVGPC
jgi:ribonuclease HI